VRLIDSLLKGNVQYVCEKYVLLLDDFDALVRTTIAKVKEIIERKKEHVGIRTHVILLGLFFHSVEFLTSAKA
jgi:hypothetical protein